MENEFREFLDNECGGCFISDEIRHEDGIDGCELIYTFSSDFPEGEVLELILDHAENNLSGTCNHSHDCCGCSFLQSTSVFREITKADGGANNYVVQFSVRRNV